MTAAARPQRIQLSRAKGFRLQEASKALNGLPAIKVDRTTRWGNPAVVGKPHPYCRQEEIKAGDPCAAPLTAEDAVRIFRCCHFTEEELTPLRGNNLACWCKLGDPCHADVLLELANS